MAGRRNPRPEAPGGPDVMPFEQSSFNPEFAGPSDWADLYRSAGLQAVPARMPDFDHPERAWKMPALKEWVQFQEEMIPEAAFRRYYGPDGQFRQHRNVGLLTGRASNNVFVLDLDTHKNEAATLWWQAQLAINSYGEEPETWKQRTGGGGRQLLFKAPPGWLAPTNRTSQGVDIRGQGGFAMLPPSLHMSRESYRWEDGFAPWQVEIASAPQWLLDAIDELVDQNGGHRPERDGEPSLRTTSPSQDFDAFANRVDGREDAMRALVWAAVMDFRRQGGTPGTPGEKQAFEAALHNYLRRTKTRLIGVDNIEGLERECRGPMAFLHKWQRAMKKWGTPRFEEEAAKPNPFEQKAAEVEEARVEERTQEASGIHATPFPWTDPSIIPPRRWVYGRHYIRDFLSTTVAPGGVGKSSLEIVELMAIATGKPLLGVEPHERCAVWYWNGEDPMEELLRRVMAVAIHFGLSPKDLEGRFFVNTGRTTPIVVAEKTRDGVIINTPVVDQVITTITQNRIGAMSIDPFVACHRVTENDNSEIERVAKTWAHIADATSCSIELVHHVRKTNGAEVSVEDGRGAVALLAAARAARAINRMSAEEAERAGIPDPQFYFRTDNGKANLAPPEGASWFHLVSIDLQNATDKTGTEPARPSDKIGVVEAWSWPDHTADVTASDMEVTRAKISAGNYRLDPQSPEWAGLAIIQVLGIESTEASRAKAKSLLDMWLKSGALRVSREPDARRKMKDFVRVGQFRD
jgi:hypothetical protein